MNKKNWEKQFDKEEYFIKDKVDGQEHCISGDNHFYLIKANEEIKQFISTLIDKVEEETEEDALLATKAIWDRMAKWQKEWREEKPKERELVMLDALKLIEWKIEKAKAEAEEKIKKDVIMLLESRQDSPTMKWTPKMFMSFLENTKKSINNK